MPQKTHYEILGVARNATTLEIQAAYTRIVIIEGPIKTRVPGPFARAQAEKHVKAAGEAWDGLRNEHLKQQYDKTLPPMDADSSASRLRTPFTDKRDEHFSTDPEGTFCYGVDSHGTEIPIIIDNRRFTVNISRKFSFTGHLEERRKPADDYDTVSFDIGLSRAHYSHEAKNPTMNEFTIKLDHIPEGLQLLSLRTLFKETANNEKILNISLSAGKCMLYRPSLPMEFGFDFDMNYAVAGAQKCDTCMVFTFLEPPEWLKASKDSPSGPDYPLRREPDLKVQEFADMGADRCVKIRYGDVEMWRLASVGYKPDPNWRKGWYNVK
jgi:curved DNA-binding protein CbpA